MQLSEFSLLRSSATLEDGFNVKKHLLCGLGGINSRVDALFLVVVNERFGLGVVGEETLPEDGFIII